MNRRNLEPLLLTLESTPSLIARAAEKLTASQARQKPATGGFSLVEHAWHLADLELEGYGARIRSILAEKDPVLSNFHGEQLARERNYQALNLAQGLATFAAAREWNLRMLRSLSRSDWKRRGLQESVGPIQLEDIPRMMSEHDRAHTREIAELLAHVKDGVPIPAARQQSAVA